MNAAAPVLEHVGHGRRLLLIEDLRLTGSVDTNSRLQPGEHHLLLNLVDLALEAPEIHAANQEVLNLHITVPALPHGIHVNLATVGNLRKRQHARCGRSMEDLAITRRALPNQFQKREQRDLFVHHAHLSLEAHIALHQRFVQFLRLVPSCDLSLVHQHQHLV